MNCIDMGDIARRDRSRPVLLNDIDREIKTIKELRKIKILDVKCPISYLMSQI
jgi:hypothetical protein